MTSYITWTIKDIKGILELRQRNQFDGNIVVSGDRGNGKSTLLVQIFNKFKGYNPHKHQVYKREDIIHLLARQTFGFCFDDEAINSGYKRDFQNKGQQELIKIVTAYRDNYNIYASAIPNFFSLDKDLRDLVFLHLHVVERGIAIVHMPVQSRLYSADRWDAKYNAKIEESWARKIQKNPDYNIPYARLSTFKGYLFFGDLTPKQRELYLKIKKEKREVAFLLEDAKEIKDMFMENLCKEIMDRKLSKEMLEQVCKINSKNYDTVKNVLNKMLKEKQTVGDEEIQGEIKTLRDYLNEDVIQNIKDKKAKEKINELVPTIEF
ncbi:MAG: hypothetical protein WC711_04095 [Candidatus Staskawiczbacteria bacterium]|jgi:hypothetical protein